MSNAAFVELPEGLIDGDTMPPVSCLVIKAIPAAEVDVMGLILRKRKEMRSQITEEVIHLSPSRAIKQATHPQRQTQVSPL